jgi:nucleoside-diphosphate-sugar epimerase
MKVMLPPAARVLITGAGGFVGHWLRQALFPVLSADATVLSIGTRSGEIKNYSACESTVALDIRDEHAVDALVGTFNPTAVLHLAAMSDVQKAHRAPSMSWDVNFYGTMNLAYSVLRRRQFPGTPSSRRDQPGRQAAGAVTQGEAEKRSSVGEVPGERHGSARPPRSTTR